MRHKQTQQLPLSFPSSVTINSYLVYLPELDGNVFVHVADADRDLRLPSVPGADHFHSKGPRDKRRYSQITVVGGSKKSQNFLMKRLCTLLSIS